MSDSERSDVDARFAEIVAHWDDPCELDDRPVLDERPTLDPPTLLEVDREPPPATPARPDDIPAAADRAGQPSADPPSEQAPSEPSPAGPPPPPPPPSPPSAPVPADADEHFRPPPPQPLPAGDLQFWAIVLGLCGGPLLLLYLIVFDREAGSLWTALAILLTLGGFGLLVARQPQRRADDGDDGARL